jgi:uroporphyrinogen decarboxylase
MNSRERIIACYAHREPDRVPCWATLTPGVVEAFRQETGHDAPADYWGWDLRTVSMLPPDPLPDLQARFGQYHRDVVGEWQLDWEHADYAPEWGVAARPAHLYHLSAPVSPLRAARTVADLAAYPFPDYVGEWRHDHLADQVGAWHRAGYAVSASVGWVFQTAWTLRGQVQLFEDFYDRPQFANALLDRICAIRAAQAACLAGSGVDMLSLNDDIGSQRDMLMSPAMWRRWIKPRLAQVIAAARRGNPAVLFRYHSDGNYTAVIPELIEVGVSALITVQQEAMEPRRIKARFGRDLTLEGTIGLQSELAHGGPDDVDRLVREQCRDLMAGGGWVVSPGNGVTPDIPLANLEALFGAIRRYGAY